MSNLMNRSFTRREKVLMLVLVIVLMVGLYFLLVHYPVVNRMEEIETEKDDLLLQQDVANARLAVYDSMKTELDEIFKLPEDQITEIPEGDNLKTLMNRFNVIFAGTEQTLSFSEGAMEDSNIMERTIRFSFNARSFEHMKEVLGELTGTGYRCLLDTLSISPVEGDVLTGELNVSGTITFYERNAE